MRYGLCIPMHSYTTSLPIVLQACVEGFVYCLTSRSHWPNLTVGSRENSGTQGPDGFADDDLRMHFCKLSLAQTSKRMGLSKCSVHSTQWRQLHRCRISKHKCTVEVTFYVFES